MLEITQDISHDMCPSLCEIAKCGIEELNEVVILIMPVTLNLKTQKIIIRTFECKGFRIKHAAFGAVISVG